MNSPSASTSRVFLSCVSSELRSYRLKLANQLGALKGRPFEVKVQEDFQQGGSTLLEALADYVRACDLVIHLVGDAAGARPSADHERALFQHLGETPPDPLPGWSYTQWEYRLARRFSKRMLVYLAQPVAPRDCGLPVRQSDDDARLQQAHLAHIHNSGEHWKSFAGPHPLIREIFYDNVDTEEAARAVEDLLGQLQSAGQVLVTSRISDWSGAVETLALDVLAEADAADFLLERTDQAKGRRKLPDDAALARTLAVELGQLALALEQAGAYICRQRLRFRKSPRHQALTEALHWINGAFVGSVQDVRTWPTLEPLAPHTRAVADHADQLAIAEPTARLMNQLGLSLLTKALHTEAEPLMRRALGIFLTSLGNQHPRTMTAQRSYIGRLQAMGLSESQIRKRLNALRTE